MGEVGAASSGAGPVPPARGRREETVDLWLAHTPGEVISERYLLVKKLDQGGMGVVWVAHHLGLDIHVALKLVHPTADMREAAERLVREAKAAARVDHPAIVHVHDVGWTSDGDPFLVMELLEGEPLGGVLAREGRLRSTTAMQIILPIAGALAAMHAKGILHRDVKPDNIFLAQDDTGRWQPKLIDFGLARLEAKPLTPITQRGMVVGTPVYLAPERIWGEEADPRDDVWSLAVALYEMVTGKVPFEGEHPAQILLAVRAGEPAAFASHGIDDPELWEIVKRGLARRRQRWASVRELGEVLARLLWQRGVAQDISGISLWPSWIDELRPRTGAPPLGTLGEIAPRPSPEAASRVTMDCEVPPSSPSAAPAPISPQATLPAQEPAASERGRFRRPESLPPLPRTTASFGLLPPTLSTPVAVVAPQRARLPVAWLAAGAVALTAIVAAVVIGRRGDPPKVAESAPLASPIASPAPRAEAAPPPASTITTAATTATRASTPEVRPSPPAPREPPAPTSPPVPRVSREAARELKDPFR